LALYDLTRGSIFVGVSVAIGLAYLIAVNTPETDGMLLCSKKRTANAHMPKIVA
jgi:hypothetical protein